MTVKELINKLKEHPGDMEVYVREMESMDTFITAETVSQIDFKEKHVVLIDW